MYSEVCVSQPFRVQDFPWDSILASIELYVNQQIFGPIVSYGAHHQSGYTTTLEEPYCIRYAETLAAKDSIVLAIFTTTPLVALTKSEEHSGYIEHRGRF